MPDANPDIETLLAELEENLRAQLARHHRLASALEAKREAIRTAQIDALAGICAGENEQLQHLGELEKRRLGLIGTLTERLEPDAAAPLTISDIAARTGAEQARRLLALRDELRETVKSVRRQSSVVRAAMESLNRHMIGILQTVRAALSGAGVYERRGRVSLGAQIDCSVDVRS